MAGTFETQTPSSIPDGRGAMGSGWNDNEGKAEEKVEDLILPEMESAHDADAIERDAEERAYKNIDKAGHYRLQVVNIGKAKKEIKDFYIGKERKRVECYVITVYFGDTNNLKYQISDQFILPATNDPFDLKNYNHGKNAEGTFSHAEKTAHFLNRLIGGFSKGQPMPPAARQPASWKGRQIEAEVKIQAAREDKNNFDPATGKPKVYPARAQIAMYSYRACGTIAPSSPSPAPAVNEAVKPEQAPAKPMPRGIDNI